MSAEHFIKNHIARNGPMDVGLFMAMVLGHPQHGYYMTRDPFGAAGDFTTAPEISQMFGEIIGAWAADLWRQMGEPAELTLLECGPGRGTLMADLLRATRVVAGFHTAVRVHFLEMSPVLKEMQANALEGFSPRWHETLNTVPTHAPVMVIANEFLDALPIRQYQKTEDGWAERVIVVRDDALVFDLGAAVPSEWMPVASLGAVVEVSPARHAFVMSLCDVIKSTKGAGLLIDYGHVHTAPGDTLQALYRHQYVSVLEHLGQADVTAHVDFEAVSRAAQDAGLAIHGPVTQGHFLKQCGIEARAGVLKKTGRDDQAADIEKALHRLTDSREMGTLFKVMGITHDHSLRPAGFADNA